MNSEKGFIVYEDSGTSFKNCETSEKWFSTYDDAMEYAIKIVQRRTSELKIGIGINSSLTVYEGVEAILHKPHLIPCGKVAFSWHTYAQIFRG